MSLVAWNLNFFSHLLHWKGVSPLWTLVCVFRIVLVLNLLPQTLHIIGFLSECTCNTCLLISKRSTKPLWQNSQKNLFSSKCLASWDSSSDGLPVIFPQNWHSYFFLEYLFWILSGIIISLWKSIKCLTKSWTKQLFPLGYTNEQYLHCFIFKALKVTWSAAKFRLPFLDLKILSLRYPKRLCLYAFYECVLQILIC